jgi:small subunit ribosomal protein S17
MTRNIGIPVTAPKEECADKHCPFHGSLSVRGKLFEGKVVSAKAKNTIVLQKESPLYFSKFKRYARSKSTIHAHIPPCIDVKEGDSVVTAECRPVSKSVSFVVVEVRKNVTG